jgi:hypothetical protein
VRAGLAPQAEPARLDAENRLVALSAATAQRRAETHGKLEGLVEVADWQRLTGLLGSARLLPTLGPRIVELAAGRAPGAFETAVSNSVEACRRQDALLQLISARIEAALVGAGISATGLKGPALGEAVFGEPGRRLSGDIDLLVPTARLSQAVAVVRELGYGNPTDPVGDQGLPLLHFALAHERGELPPVELHWRVHWYETRFAQERLLAPHPDALEWRPERADELAALLLFYARDGFTGLRQAADLGAWWDRFGAELVPGALDETARTYPQLRPAILAALQVADAAVGVPAGEIAGGEGIGLRGRIAVHLADPRPYASEEQLFAEIGLIDGLLAPRRSLGAFFRRQVTPSREVLRDHAEKAMSTDVGSPLGYGARMLGRYALALGRLLHLPYAARSRFST